VKENVYSISFPSCGTCVVEATMHLY